MPPTSSAPKPERDNLQWVKLKTYITNRRNEEIQEKEKEEELAKKRKLLEEEYLKTKEELEKVQKEISEKNTLLKQYGDEKHELFSQLKKVLLDDDNRKRLESEKNEHTLLLNNLNHSNQAQIFISQAPMSNSTIQPIPLNSSSSIYKLPMATATVIPTPHSINNKRTHSPAPLPTSIAVQQPQLHPSYAAYKHPIPGNATMFSAQQQMKLNEEQQKHIVLSQQQQQQQLRQQHQQASQQHQQQQQQQSSQQQQQGRGGPMSHHQQQAQNNEYIQRNIMNWQQQQQMNSNAKNTAGGAYPHYFPPGQPHVPTSQYQQPRSTDSKPAPIFLHQQQHHQQQPQQQQHQQQQQQQHQQRSAYDDKYHFQLRLPNQHGGPPPVSSAGSNQHPSPKGGSITAGYPIRGLPGTRVVASMVPNNVTYHQQNMHKFIPHSQSGSNNK